MKDCASRRMRWDKQQTKALIDGVERHHTSWALILQDFAEQLGERSQVQLKDRWRNLVLAVKYHKQTRGDSLDHHLKIKILQLVHTINELPQ